MWIVTPIIIIACIINQTFRTCFTFSKSYELKEPNLLRIPKGRWRWSKACDVVVSLLGTRRSMLSPRAHKLSIVCGEELHTVPLKSENMSCVPRNAET